MLGSSQRSVFSGAAEAVRTVIAAKEKSIFFNIKRNVFEVVLVNVLSSFSLLLVKELLTKISVFVGFQKKMADKGAVFLQNCVTLEIKKVRN